MKKTFCWIIGFMMILGLSAWAADFTLNEKDTKSLSPEALAFYQKGQTENDFVRYDTALDQFVKAQKADPRNIPIRFLVARMAETEARKKMGDESISLYRKAETALTEIVALKGIGAKPSDIEHAQNALDIIRERILQQTERDQRRLKVGKEIVQERAKEIFATQIRAEQKKLAEKAALEKEKQAKARKPGSTPTPGVGGMGGSTPGNPMGMMMRMPAR